MFGWGRYRLDRFIASLPTPVYWLALALCAVMAAACLISILGMLLPLIIAGGGLWFFMECTRDPRFYDLINRLRGSNGGRRF